MDEDLRVSGPAFPPGATAAEHSDLPADVGLSISEVGRELDIAPETLRKWQFRYGLGPSRNSAGGHRRYIRADLTRLRRVRDLIARGVPTADAARQVLRSEATGLPPIGGDPVANRLAAATAQLDGPSIRHLLDHELARRGVVDTWEELLRPVLVAVGIHARDSAHGIAMEHVLSHVIQAALAVPRATEPTAPIPPPGAPAGAMLACAPDEQHELPLVALAAALAERGIATTVLGAQTPLDALTTAASVDGGLVVVFALLPHQAPEYLADPLPDARIIAAGPGWDPTSLAPRVTHVNSLPEAVAVLETSGRS